MSQTVRSWKLVKPYAKSTYIWISHSNFDFWWMILFKYTSSLFVFKCLQFVVTQISTSKMIKKTFGTSCTCSYRIAWYFLKFVVAGVPAVSHELVKTQKFLQTWLLAAKKDRNVEYFKSSVPVTASRVNKKWSIKKKTLLRLLVVCSRFGSTQYLYICSTRGIWESAVS